MAKDPEAYPWRAILDDLDGSLWASGALGDPAVFDARAALGRAIGCLLDSIKHGTPVAVSARTFPPYDENGRPVPHPNRRRMSR